jgi:hypothetical protein
VAIKDRILNIAQGNPGALRVLVDMAQQGANDALLDLERAGVHGGQVWLIFKDGCGQDLAATIEACADVPAFLQGQSERFRSEWDSYA